MIRGALPAARVAQYVHALDGRAEVVADPDMVEPPPLIGFRPVRRAVAPPGIELVRIRYELAQRVDPFAGGMRPRELLDLDRRVADDREELLVAPDVVLQRRDVEIAHQNRPPRRDP